MGFYAVVIGNLFPISEELATILMVNRSIAMQIYAFDTQLGSDAKNLWRICTVGNSYPFPT
jgi:hypothetical protein